MLSLSMITGAVAWIATHIWVLLLAVAPAVLNFVSPLFKNLSEGGAGFVSTVWEGAKTNKFANWMFALVVGVVAFAVGYHYGWWGAIDWGHEHYRWIAKKTVTSAWWQFW